MIFPQSIRQGDTGRCDQIGLGRAEKWTRVSPCPTEVYNLAAQSHVQVSFQMPMYTAEVDGVGTLNLLEAGADTRSLQSST